MKKNKVAATKLTGSEILINSLFWALMALSGIGLLLYGGYQIFRKLSGKPLHYFKVGVKNEKLATEDDESVSDDESNKSSSYKETSRQFKHNPQKKSVFPDKSNLAEDSVVSQKSQRQEKAEAKQNVLEGFLIKFKFVEDKNKNAKIPAKKQAKTILNQALKDLANLKDGQGVAITYSANLGQTKNLAKAYIAGKPTANIGGSNQAEVAKAIEKLLLEDVKYKALQNRFHFIPITTLQKGVKTTEVSDNIIVRDLRNLACHLGAGWKVYGWQNENTNFKYEKKFAVGGGIKKLSTHQNNIIQHSLLYLSDHKDLLPDNPEGSWDKGVDAKAAAKFESARKMGEKNGDPLAYVKTWHNRASYHSAKTLKK